MRGDVIRAGTGYPIFKVYLKSDDSLINTYTFENNIRINKLNEPEKIKKTFRNTHGEIKEITIGVQLTGMIEFEYITETKLNDLISIYDYSTQTDTYYVKLQPYSNNTNLNDIITIDSFNFDKHDDYTFNDYYANLNYSFEDIDMNFSEVISL